MSSTTALESHLATQATTSSHLSTISLLWPGGPADDSIFAATEVGAQGDTITYSVSCLPTVEGKTCVATEARIVQASSTWDFQYTRNDSKVFEYAPYPHKTNSPLLLGIVDKASRRTMRANCSMKPDLDVAECTTKYTMSRNSTTSSLRTETFKAFSTDLVAATVVEKITEKTESSSRSHADSADSALPDSVINAMLLGVVLFLAVVVLL